MHTSSNFHASNAATWALCTSNGSADAATGSRSPYEIQGPPVLGFRVYRVVVRGFSFSYQNRDL